MDDILYSLPDDLRDKLKEPIGLLVNEEELLRLLLKEEHIVSVGDQVTYTLLKNGIEPIITGETTASKLGNIISFNERLVLISTHLA